MDKRRRRHGDAARTKALADAAAGVVGSLVAVLAFYPIDVWKTSLQADVTATPSSDAGRATAARSLRARLPPPSRLFRGLPLKVAHTVVSSFTYFFVYSLVRTRHAARRRRGGAPPAASAATQLLLAAFAAALNSCITLPLDTLAARRQAGPSGEEEEGRGGRAATDAGRGNRENEDTSSSCDRDSEGFCSAHGILSDGGEEEEKEDDSPGTSQLYIKTPRKFQFSFSTNLVQEAFGPAAAAAERRQGRWTAVLSLWNGLFPALLLSSNPAIQYTAYDALKGALLQPRPARAKLSLWEAFACGLVAKFCATVVTYPLIRAKILLMLAPVGPREDAGRDMTDRRPSSLPPLLVHIFCHDGVRGLYKGCSVQLLHTLMKSALMMMVRERITAATHQLFRVEGEGGAA